jgi:hypothetical protein
MEDVAQDFIEGREDSKKEDGSQRYAPSYVQSHLKAVKSWAEWNNDLLSVWVQQRYNIVDIL